MAAPWDGTGSPPRRDVVEEMLTDGSVGEVPTAQGDGTLAMAAAAGGARFKTITYVGDGDNGVVPITGIGFQADGFDIWGKDTGIGGLHILVSFTADSLTDGNSPKHTYNGTPPPTFGIGPIKVASIDADGFTLNKAAATLNINGMTYYVRAWKEG